jgi:hypothetical protein
MRQRRVDTLITEEPDDRIGHVRICGGDGQQWRSLPGETILLCVVGDAMRVKGKNRYLFGSSPSTAGSAVLRPKALRR